MIKHVQLVIGGSSGTCPIELSPAQRMTIVNIVEPWRSRPVNFAFLRSALVEEGVWDLVVGERGTISGKTLDETAKGVEKQTEETGGLADVGKLDIDTLETLLGGLPETATTVIEKLATAAPRARVVLLQQIDRRGKLATLLDALPRIQIEGLHAAIVPYDAQRAAALRPYFENQGGGRSMHRIYLDQVDMHLEAIDKDSTTTEAYSHTSRAFAWFLLDRIHNAFTGGFQHEYSAAYDAYEQGLITKDEFKSAATKALGKAAVITVASAVTGGVAGELGQGFAMGLGAGRSAAQLIGGAAGGFAGGVGGHFAGDVYDQALNGKEGFDSVGDYMKSGAIGGVTGTVLSGVSLGAGKYLPESQQRTIDLYAREHPRLGGALEAIRAAGVRGGTEVRAAGQQTATVVRMTVKELVDLFRSGTGGGPDALTVDGLGPTQRLRLDTQVDVWIRPRDRDAPMQMSSQDQNRPASEQSVVVVEKVEVAGSVKTPEPSAELSAPKAAEPDPVAAESAYEIASSGGAHADVLATARKRSPGQLKNDIAKRQGELDNYVDILTSKDRNAHVPPNLLPRLLDGAAASVKHLTAEIEIIERVLREKAGGS